MENISGVLNNFSNGKINSKFYYYSIKIKIVFFEYGRKKLPSGCFYDVVNLAGQIIRVGFETSAV